VWNALTAAATAAKAAGDPRSLDQLRADELLARTTGTPLPPPAPGDTLDADEAAEPADDGREDEPTVGNTRSGDGTDGTGSACSACGQEPDSARMRRSGRPLNVSLTLPLSSYLGLAADPGRLDGFGPVAAAVARQIIGDTARNNSDGSGAITWRSVVVDDVHGTVLGVGVPLRVSKHEPAAEACGSGPHRRADVLLPRLPNPCPRL
jgi:hypothetical protein